MFVFYFMFPFSFKFLQTSVITQELIKHKNKFNRKFFHALENSENRFSEFSYFMTGFISWTFLSSLHNEKNYREIRISWNVLKELFHSVSRLKNTFLNKILTVVWTYFHLDCRLLFQRCPLLPFSVYLFVGKGHRITIFLLWILEIPYPANKYSKSTTETLKQDVKYAKN